jgi:quinone-modifying oxidoreductase subunit QmoC
MAGARVIEPDLDFIRSLKGTGGDTLKKCYQCATCSTVCNLSPEENPFPRKEMLMAGWGQADDLMKDPNGWLCYQCNDCTTRCPRGARPGDVLAAVRSFAYRRFAFPSFMGRALASPRALPLLLLVPIVLITACIFLTAPRTVDGSFEFMTSEVIDFNIFLPHSSVDALFVFGNILIFLLAAIGFTRFWRMLQGNEEASQMSFWQAAKYTIREIFSHSRFRECGTNHPRAIGHIVLFYGFVGAMVTTGLVLLLVFLPHYLHLLGVENINSFFTVPLGVAHPVKLLGIFSGIALFVGGGLLVYRRWTNRDDVGANGYTDYLFLYIMFLTGFTGMTAYLTRLSGVAWFAYANYFIHIVCVYFLLWYMPYSKFAHMIYRSLALVYARQTGRLK